MKNESKTRVVRVYAQDLAKGDVLVSAERDPLGVIDDDPDVDYRADQITFGVRQPGGAIVPRVSQINKVHRIEISRGGETR